MSKRFETLRFIGIIIHCEAADEILVMMGNDGKMGSRHKTEQNAALRVDENGERTCGAKLMSRGSGVRCEGGVHAAVTELYVCV